MSSQLIDDIREQEDSIFEELGCLESRDQSVFKHANESARYKARQQLAISPDSPFSHLQSAIEHSELDKLKIERAGALRDETDEIRRQLDFVKSRLEELKNHKNQKNDAKDAESKPSLPNPPYKVDYSANSGSRSAHKSVGIKRLNQQANEAKLRPLTGQADCPNCTCDRRNSVCNQCMSLNLIKPVAKSRTSVKATEPKRVSYDDERPIRPAKDRTLATVEANVDDVVVPGRVYTISKSLNEKRTKLAQAIDDLQMMMNQVKERENKLSRERKVVQLYKDQWKYGPSIGGPKASSREQLGTTQRRHYQSRMDPNLSRDIRSVMGFQTIEPGLKLRQYDSPKPAVRTSKFKPSIHARSKSLESLRPPVDTTRGAGLKNTIANFQNGKPSSEINLNSESAVEEQIEDEIKIDDPDERVSDTGRPTEPEPEPEPSTGKSSSPDNELDEVRSESSNREKSQKMAWIPVFGETEVKTVKRAPAKRKIQIVTPDERPSSGHFKSKPLRPAQMKSSLKKSSNVDQQKTVSNTLINKTQSNSNVMVEAERKLKMASDLLEQEQRDSVTKNQLVINKPRPLPRQSTFSKADSNTKKGDSIERNYKANLDPMKEIERLEEMVREQQQLVARLTQHSRENRITSPIVVGSQPCCHHSSPCQHSASDRYCSSPTTGGRRLIHSLRDRLNRTKTRLARTLEEEREKHQQLQMKVDSSLRKQSDLENENELLKKSLSKCIDTCLKDISSTFESLSDTLDDSILSLDKQQTEEDDKQSTSGSSILTNAAQLIQNNRHLKQMQSHIQTIERQRKGIFEELNKEKQKSNQLESKLKESQSELDQLNEIKRKLESQLNLVAKEQSSSSSKVSNSHANQDETQVKAIESIEADQLPSTSRQTRPDVEDQKESDKSDLDDSYTCVDLYRRYIESISPDIESLRRERKLLLSEFENNIKKVLSDLDS